MAFQRDPFLSPSMPKSLVRHSFHLKHHRTHWIRSVRRISTDTGVVITSIPVPAARNGRPKLIPRLLHILDDQHRSPNTFHLEPSVLIRFSRRMHLCSGVISAEDK